MKFREEALSEKDQFNWQVQFSGTIDGAVTSWPQLNLERRYVFDMSAVSSINSAGAQSWIQWVRLAPKGLSIGMDRIPVPFIRMANSIPGVLPVEWAILSFWVPYYCAAENAAENILFVVNQHFDRSHVTIPPLVRSQRTGNRLELDVHPDSYFRFLRQRNPSFKVVDSL